MTHSRYPPQHSHAPIYTDGLHSCPSSNSTGTRTNQAERSYPLAAVYCDMSSAGVSPLISPIPVRIQHPGVVAVGAIKSYSMYRPPLSTTRIIGAQQCIVILSLMVQTSSLAVVLTGHAERWAAVTFYRWANSSTSPTPKSPLNRPTPPLYEEPLPSYTPSMLLYLMPTLSPISGPL